MSMLDVHRKIFSGTMQAGVKWSQRRFWTAWKSGSAMGASSGLFRPGAEGTMQLGGT